MSKSIVLIAPEVVTLRKILTILEDLESLDCRYISTNRDEIYIQNKSGDYVSFVELQSIEDTLSDYLENEDIPSEIKGKLRGKIFYLCTFNDYKFCSRIINILLFSFNQLPELEIFIDNDYGDLIPMSTIISEFADNCDWDWRNYRMIDN